MSQHIQVIGHRMYRLQVTEYSYMSQNIQVIGHRIYRLQVTEYIGYRSQNIQVIGHRTHRLQVIEYTSCKSENAQLCKSHNTHAVFCAHMYNIQRVYVVEYSGCRSQNDTGCVLQNKQVASDKIHNFVCHETPRLQVTKHRGCRSCNTLVKEHGIHNII